MITYWRRRFLGVELGIAIALTLAFGIWIKVAHGGQLIAELIGGQRSAVYGTFATLDGALLGFVLATAAIILGFAQSDQFATLRDSTHYPTLWRTLTSTIRVLGLATLVAIIAMLVDRDGRSNALLMVLCAGTTLLSAFRIARTVWVLEGSIRIMINPGPRSTRGMLRH